MASSTPTMPINAAIAVTTPEDAFRQLWTEALLKCEQSMGNDASQWQSLLQRLDGCHKAEDVCVILDETMVGFDRFRGSGTTWGKLRNKYLKPAIEVLLLFNDAIAETAASFPNVPGGKAIFIAFGALLQATKGVSAYCEALILLFEELNVFLESLRPRLTHPSGLGSASRTIAITILSHLLDVMVHAVRLMAKRPWLGRISMFGKALLKDTTMQSALGRLRALTTLETRAIAAETQVVASQTLDKASDNLDSTNLLLLEMQILNQGQVQAVTSRELIERGIGSVLKGQNTLMEMLRGERQQRDNIDASEIIEKLKPVGCATIDAQSPEGCMGETRVQILEDLRTWSRNPTAPVIYWLNGMAGTGKSAIARSFCQSLHQDGLLGGSFFCSRSGSVEEGDARRIIPTLSAIMATRSAGFSMALSTILTREPFYAYWNPKLQINCLLRMPLLLYADDAPRMVLVIDALDECSDEEITRKLISWLVEASCSLPVKFFMTSRPEPHIRRQLESIHPDLGKVLRLHDVEQDLVKSDISLYLTHGLRAMREPSFPPLWPSEADITTLTDLSGKLFIYSFTALQYIRKDPVTRLAKLTEAPMAAGRPMTKPLDDIYNLILSEAMDPDQYDDEEINLTRHIISMIVTVREPLSVVSLSGLLGLSTHRLRGALNRLYAVIYIPLRDDSGVLSVFHASFADFITTPARAPTYMGEHVSSGHATLADICLKILSSNKLCFNVAQATTSYLPNTEQSLAYIDGALRYACLHSSYHIFTADFESLHLKLEQVFMGPKFLFWLEVLSAVGLAGKASTILSDTMKFYQKNHKHPEFALFLAGAIEFTKTFEDGIALSVPHIYVSALALCDYHAANHCIQPYTDPFFSHLAGFAWQIVDNYRAAGSIPLCCAAYSPDGRCVAAGMGSGELYVWDVGTKLIKDVLDFHSNEVLSVAYAPNDHNCIAAGFKHGRVRVWNVHIGSNSAPTVLCSYEHDDGVRCIAFSPDGSMIVSGSGDNTVGIWDLHSGRLISDRLLKGHTHHVEAVSISPNGLFVASSSVDTTIRIWDATTGKSTTLLQGHTLTVTSVAFMPSDDMALVSGSQDNTVRIWDIISGTNTMMLKGHTGPVSSVLWSLDGTRIVSGSEDRTLLVWDAMTGALTVPPLDTHEPISSISFAPDNKQVLSVSKSSGSVRIWKVDGSDEDSEECDIDLNDQYLDKDGWIRGPNAELLIWVPEEFRKFWQHPRCTAVLLGPLKTVALHLRDTARGTKWTRCYRQPSQDVAS